jgi:Animal haem peroxidase
MQSSNVANQPIRLWWGPMLDRSKPGELATPTDPPRSRDGAAAYSDTHNLYRSYDPKDRFRADGLIDDEGHVNKPELHRLLAGLAMRIAWGSPADDTLPENSGLPSGYTYLMQFVAHDLVDSVASVRRDGGMLRPTMRNVRASALMLDALYGAGPEELPHAYAVTDSDLDAGGVSPRTRLRLGVRQTKLDANPTTYCPYRDLARMCPAKTDGLSDANLGLLTETGIADPRNDQHAIVSQLTVLFGLLHNHILDVLEQSKMAAGASKTEDAQRRYLCVRFVVTLIYRNILEKDVLPRLLDAKILERYRKEDKAIFDGDKAVPIEFTHGAFRFGHAMVRDTYMIRSEATETTRKAQDFSALRLPRELPVKENWFVDWARFFDTSKPGTPGFKRNYSHTIGPHYARALLAPELYPPRSDADFEGLPSRDLLSGAYAGLLSARALTDKMRTVLTDQLVPSFDSWHDRIITWLNKVPVPTLSAADCERIANDPPLPFFVLLEAEIAGGGAKLGPVGSVIVADTIFGALRSNPTGFEAPGTSLRDRIKLCADTFFLDDRDTARSQAIADAAKDALAGIGEIGSMPELLEFLANVGAFPSQ